MALQAVIGYETEAFPPERSMLSSLESAEFDALRRLFVRVTPATGTILGIANEPVAHLWFPDGGVASLVVRLGDGQTVEAGLVGREGMIGLGVLLGDGRGLLSSVVQIPGPFWRCPIDVVGARAAEFPGLQRAVLGYSGASIASIAQFAACNATHSLRQRMARWLLMAHDRVGRDRFGLTHEFIATMINVRRAGVSQFASEMRQAGAIAYTRGEILVTNRLALEHEACECYSVIKRLTFDRLGTR
jgi:CRP-like cAMP-binding protein